MEEYKENFNILNVFSSETSPKLHNADNAANFSEQIEPVWNHLIVLDMFRTKTKIKTKTKQKQTKTK